MSDESTPEKTDTEALPDSADWRSAEQGENPAAPALPPPPPPSVNVGQLIWAAIIIMAGVLVFIVGIHSTVNMSILLIGSLILLGLGLIVAAVVTASKEGR